jgi:flagellar FliL protein
MQITKEHCRYFSLTFLLWFFLGLSAPVYSEDTPAAVGPSYVDLEPSFTLNYGSANRLRYIQASITLRVRDSTAALDVAAHSDAIRHSIIMLFSRQTSEEIKTSAGRDKFLDQALKELQDLMVKETGRTLIDRVLFTDFIIQS